MNIFEKIIESFKIEIKKPTPYGTFHLVSLAITVFFIILICIPNKKHNEFKLRFALGMYDFSSLIL